MNWFDRGQQLLIMVMVIVTFFLAVSLKHTVREYEHFLSGRTRSCTDSWQNYL